MIPYCFFFSSTSLFKYSHFLLVLITYDFNSPLTYIYTSLPYSSWLHFDDKRLFCFYQIVFWFHFSLIPCAQALLNVVWIQRTFYFMRSMLKLVLSTSWHHYYCSLENDLNTSVIFISFLVVKLSPSQYFCSQITVLFPDYFRKGK
jgi:hypothetical protein